MQSIVLQYLLETNVRQRGDVGGSAKKVGLRIKGFERIYGIKQGRHGSNQYVQNSNNFKSAKIQEQLASQMGMDVLKILCKHHTKKGGMLHGKKAVGNDLR